MANVLSTDKKIAVIGALAEGSSIRSIERITGVHRDTIMRLGVSVGQGCAALMDAKMRDLPCERLEFDEIWGIRPEGSSVSPQGLCMGARHRESKHATTLHSGTSRSPHQISTRCR